jgi:hypothetical protein
MGLSDAIDRIRTIHDREQHLAAPREVMARHLGYTGLNGTSLKTLSALLKYGLLEKTKDDKRKVTDLAVQILHPRTPQERKAAILEAASRPALFAEIAKEWPNGTPSDENLSSYLIRRNFAADAIGDVIAAYRATMELVTRESEGYSPPNPHLNVDEVVEKVTMQQHGQKPGNPVPTTGEQGPPFRVSFIPGGIEVVAKISDLENAEELIKTINALKLLLKPAAELKKPE